MSDHDEVHGKLDIEPAVDWLLSFGDHSRYMIINDTRPRWRRFIARLASRLT